MALKITDGALTVTGTLTASAGTVGAPSITLGDATTGLYRSAENQIGVSISGSNKATFTSAGLSLPAGSAANPSLKFGDATNTGIYGTTNSTRISIEGTARVHIQNSTLFDLPLVEMVSDGNYFSLSLISYRSDFGHDYLYFQGARGTLASPACLNSGDSLGEIIAAAWQTDAPTRTFANCGILRFVATENHSSTAMGTKLQIYITPNGSATAELGLELDQDKSLIIYGPLSHIGSSAGFFNTTATTKKTVSGARNNPEGALKSFIEAMAAYGLVTNSTTSS